MKLRCALAAMAIAPTMAAAQACSSELPGGRQVESARYAVGYRTIPGKIAVGKHFSIELAVCPKGGGQAPDSVRIDAQMPEHKHGMNYQADVVVLPAGRYRAEGLMFHMPGRWEFIFDLRAAGRTDRLTQSLVLE